MTRNLIIPAGILALLVHTAPVSSAIVFDGNYARVWSELDAGSGPSSGGDTIVTNGGFADTGTTDVVNGNFSANGRALANIRIRPDLKSISSSNAPDAVGPTSAFSSTLVRASWRDALLPGSAGAPATLDFNFSVHARMTISQTTDSGIAGNINFSQAGVSVNASDRIVGFLCSTILSGLSANVSNFNGASTVTEANNSSTLNWETAVFTSLGLNEYEFSGGFTFTSPLVTFLPATPDAPFGAYFPGVGLTTQTSNVGGTSTGDAFSTLTLDSITMPNGNIISAADFAFESGTALNAVPLPPSWLLMLSAIAVSLTRLRRKSV